MWWRRRRALRDLDRDIQTHLDHESDDLIARGVSPDEARRQARVRFGSAAAATEDTRAAWGWTWIERAGQDIRFAVRLFLRRPVLSVSAVVTLALGIGGATATFGLFDALLVRKLPVAAPDELVKLVEPRPSLGYTAWEFTVATHDSLRPAVQTLSSVLAASTHNQPRDIEIDGEPARAVVQYVSDNYFELLGIDAIQGQAFRTPGPGLSDAPIAVISADHWRSDYASSPSIVGSRFRLPGRPEITVVGVAQDGFRGLELDAPVDAWILIDQWIEPNDDDRSRGRGTSVMGRLKDGTTLEEASSEASAVLGKTVRFEPAATGYSDLRRTLSAPLTLVGLAVASVLLVACANLANLMLAGTAARSHELALRTAIGASRTRVIQQIVTEGLLTAAIGGTLGIAIAWWFSGSLLAYLPPEDARILPNIRFMVDLRLLGFAVLVVTGTALAIGLVPAFRATRHLTASSLTPRTVAGHPSRSWLTRGLVVSQIGLCVLSLVVAATFVRTLQNLRGQDAGYVENNLVVADVRPPGTDDDDRDRWIETLRSRVAALHGIDIAAFSSGGQLDGTSIQWTIGFPGQPTTDEPPSAIEQRISPGFLPAMGTHVIAGRDFVASDDVRAPLVAIVNEAFAHRFFPGRDPIGARFFREGGTFGGNPMEIVGIVRDSKWHDLREQPPVMYYRPYRQMGGTPEVRFAIRTSLSAMEIESRLMTVAQSLAPHVTVSNVVPFRTIVDRTLVVERLVAHVSGVFGALVLGVVAVGLYGVVAHGVARRRREIGLRVAIGAQPGAIEWMFLRESLVLVLIGVAVGLPMALIVTRWSASMLFGLAPHDPLSLAVSLFLLATTVITAAWIPARRAAGADPLVALREE